MQAGSAVITIQEAVEKALKEMRGDKIRPFIVEENENQFLLNVAFDEGEERFVYPIGFRRCDTPEKISRWVIHLCGKQWVGKELLESFVREALSRIGIDPFPV